MAITVQITFDCADPTSLANFWCLALGYELDSAPAPFTSWPEALTAWGIPESEWNSRAACSDPEGKGPTSGFSRSQSARLPRIACTWISAQRPDFAATSG
ncbi:VOC family protein [Corynebacterium sp. LK2510]